MIMLLLTHIIIALSSLAWTTYLFFRPSKSGLRLAYGLVAATLASGIYLVIITRSPLTQSCLSGLLYIGASSAGIVSARYKLLHTQQ